MIEAPAAGLGDGLYCGRVVGAGDEHRGRVNAPGVGDAVILVFHQVPVLTGILVGMVATGVFTLPKGFSLTVTPEIDDLENADLHGHHAQLVGALNLAKALSSKLTANAELWASQNYDPSGTVRQYSADGAVAALGGRYNRW